MGASRGSSGVERGTGQKTGIASRLGRSPAGRTSVIVSVEPRAVIPEICAAFPALNAVAPTMSGA